MLPALVATEMVLAVPCAACHRAAWPQWVCRRVTHAASSGCDRDGVGCTLCQNAYGWL